MSYLTLLTEDSSKGAVYTSKEILQQPKLWMKTFEIIEGQKVKIQNFIKTRVLEKGARIIFTGAGTSAYVGDTASPLLRKNIVNQVDSIPTTDLVSNPLNYLKENVPTVLVSFARSGNSPESIGAYKLAKQLVKNLSQIIITCNHEGELAKIAINDPDSLVILMPKESNDLSFAMTSSFSCMYLSSLLLFNLDNLNEYKQKVQQVAQSAERILAEQYQDIINLVNLNKKKVVYLGSSTLKGLVQETSLKNMELAAGAIPTFFESVLGFRHGPKSIIDDETLLFVFISNDSYTRQYDLDLLQELKNDGGSKTVVAVSYANDPRLNEYCDVVFLIPDNTDADLEDNFVALNYLLYGQLYALFNSIQLGISPDNPCPTGEVNRVVKGVQLYSFVHSVI